MMMSPSTTTTNDDDDHPTQTAAQSLPSLPFDVLVELLDQVTLAGDWASRVGLLLTFRDLRAYSLSVTHMRIVVRKWHARGCGVFRNMFSAMLPKTLSSDWFSHILSRSKHNGGGRRLAEDDNKEKQTPLPRGGGIDMYMFRCSICGRMSLPWCAVM